MLTSQQIQEPIKFYFECFKCAVQTGFNAPEYFERFLDIKGDSI